MRDEQMHTIGILCSLILGVVAILYLIFLEEKFVEPFTIEKPLAAEVLQTQRIPRSSQLQEGVVLIVDLTIRGTKSAMLHALTLPTELAVLAETDILQLWRDTGDNVWNQQDIQVSLTPAQSLHKKSKMQLNLSHLDDGLLLGYEETFAQEESTISPHNRHRFFLILPSNTASLSLREKLPIPLKIMDADSLEQANIIGRSLIDERTFERLADAYERRSDFLKKNPIFSAGEGVSVVLSGDHIFHTTVIVPSTVELVIQPGTTIRMDPDVSLLSYAPVSMVGKPKNPIRFLASTENEPWGVFGVVNSKKESRVQWAEFSDGSQAYINGIFISGMLAFHSSSAHIYDVSITNAHGDDGINLKNSVVDVRNTRFEGNDFDGLDIDMATSGLVEKSTFIGNRNDGIDISWSSITIHDVTVDGSDDKCISVGEKSTPIITDSTVKNCDFGIAVKDESEAEIHNVRFENNRIGIGAYMKKVFFNPPTAKSIDSIFIGNTADSLASSGAVISIQ